MVELDRGSDGGWVRRVVGGAVPPGRDSDLLNGPLPTGRLLEELLLGACLRHDLATVRRLLTGWAAWTATLPGTPDPAFDNVLLDGDGYALLDPSRPGPGQALRRFAELLLAGGYAHPWAMASDVDALTAVLSGAAGLTAPPAVEAAARPAPLPLREHEEELCRLRGQLADADARARWFAAELAGRDAELRRVRLQIKAFSGTLGYRVAKLGAVSARKARSALLRGRKDH